jgi:phosphoribosylanthranilate isomerase
MLHPTNEEWRQVLQGFGPDVLQTDAEDFANLDVPADIEHWPVYRENMVSVTVTDTFVYEGPKSGRGETVDWVRAAEVAKQGNMILAGGLSVANVGEAIDAVRPYGVDVSSGVESAPGQKDAALIREFIKAARAAEKML